MPTLLLASCVSPLILDSLVAWQGSGDFHLLEFDAVVALIDIRGFTPLAERLSRRGPVGLELLASLADDCFGKIAEMVHESGGIIHAYPGDAAIALWRTSSHSLAEVTSIAADCAHALTTLDVNPRLPLKAGIGVGRVISARLGGVEGRYELLVTGEPFVQMGLAVARARQREVILSPAAVSVLGLPADAGTADGHASWTSTSRRSDVRLRVHVPSADVRPESLHPFLPEGISARIAAGEEGWIGSIRKLSVTFVRLPSLREQGLELRLVHQAFCDIQEAYRQLDGSIVQLCHDDKGVVVLAAFGLPRSHEDDGERSLRVAMQVERRIKEHGLRVQIGIATGRLVCGMIGGPHRSEFRIVGSVVNVASRLMEIADEGILCDQATMDETQRIAFETPFAAKLKGIPSPTIVARPKEATSHGSRPPRALVLRDPLRVALCGRDHELDLLASWLGGRPSSDNILVLRGEAGIGKSVLAARLTDLAIEKGSPVFVGYSDPMNSTAAYHPWRTILEQALDLDAALGPGTIAERTVALVTDIFGTGELAPGQSRLI